MNQAQIQKMMKEAQKLQKQMEKEQSSLQSKTYKNSAGGGVIEIEMSGDKQIKHLFIDEKIIDKDDKDMLEEMIMNLINSTIKEIEKESEDVMGQLTKGLPF